MRRCLGNIVVAAVVALRRIDSIERMSWTRLLFLLSFTVNIDKSFGNFELIICFAFVHAEYLFVNLIEK